MQPSSAWSALSPSGEPRLDPKPDLGASDDEEVKRQSIWATALDVVLSIVEPIAWCIGGALRLLAWMFAAALSSCS